MKLKRMVAFVMAAALFLSSAFVDTGMRSVYAETNEIQYEADPEELSGEFGGVKNGENALPAPHEKVTEYSEEETSETAVLKEADRSEYDIDLTEKQNAEIVEREEIDPEEMVRVIIVMDGDSIIDDNPKAKMSFFNEMKIGLLEMKQDSVVSRIEKKVLDRGELDVRYQYTWLLNGVATEIPYGMIEEVEAVSGVKEVVVQSKYNVSEAKASARTISDGGMIGREDTWAKGYTGKGMKIAIVDTGLDTDHQNFQPLDEELLTEESATLETVAENLDKLNAGSTYADLRADHLYRDTKVAYGFNYVDNSLDITHDNDAQGDHGTHVAGIAAANKVAGSEVVGVAPDAQLYIMKVFGRDGGAYTDDIIASLEDALILGADVVNMSLGTPAGFSTDGELIDQVYESVGNTKTVLAIAAGNAYTSGLNNVWGLNTNLASNPDNSTMSTPATYVNATTIASVNNEKLKAFSINAGDKKFAYTEVVNETIDRISQLAGEELEYAMVGNFGQNESDFTDADVAGKVAVVQRGVSYFGEKAEFAQKAGAIACIVYNNTTGSFGMDFAGYPEVTIPSCAISLAAGEYLAEQLTNNADATLSFSLKEEILVNEEGYKMSDFSSWGVSPDLRLEPDMTAPGGDIYSTRDGGTYGLMSGTSMASPNAAGLATLVMQHLKAEYPELSDVEKQDLVNNLLMSTAEPLKYDEEVLYSPRSQGSGLANAYSAITTEAYLTVDGMDVPKVELKDDPAKAGKYSYDFKIHNFGARDLYYTLNTTAATEGVLDAGMKFMSVTPVNLDAVTAEASEAMVLTYDYNEDSRTNTADARILYIGLAKANESDEAFRYNLSGDADLVIDEADVQAYLDALVDKEVDADLGAECVKVEAGKEAKVSVNVDVTQAGKDYMDANFENGIYVEGFTMLEAQNKEGVDLSLPYLAFYGDWTEAPVIDTGFYWEEEPGHSQYPNVLLTKFGDYDWYPGINPYFPEAPINPEHISVSPNEDGYGDYISDIYVGLLRNAKTLKFTYENQQDPSEQYFRCEVEHAAKTYYVTQYDMMLPYVYSWKNPEYKLTDADGNVLANDTKVNLKIEAEIDYPLEDGRTANNDNGVVEIPFTVDTEAPVVIGNPEVSYDAESGKYFITLNFKDNVDVAGVHVLNKSATNVLESYAPEQLEKTENGYTVKLDVTGRGSELVLILGDYAMNESAYRVEVPGNEPVVDTNLLYGYRIADEEIADDTLFGWLGINPENAKTSVQSSEAYMDYALTAAEYVGGYIVAVDANNDFVFMKPGYWDERTKIRSLEVNIDELAFDPVGKVLYGYDSDNYKLVTIDLITGEVNNAGYQYLSGVVSMTCGNDGTLYGIDSYGNLKTINKETGEFDQTVLLETTAVTGLEPKYTQSMTYDAAEDCIYWAYCGSTMATGFKGVLYKIDVKNDYEMTKVGKIAGNAEVVGLLKLDSRGFELPADQPLEGISIEQESAVMLVKDKMPLTAVMTPWYAKTGGLVWSVEDSTIAKVEQDGVVTGINPGKTVVTVAAEDGKYQASCSVKVVQPEATVNGFVLGNQAQTLRNQWITADLQDMNHYTANTANHFMTYYAGEYVDGYIYAYNGSSEFYKINAETYEAKRVAEVSRKYQVIDMAYDYSGAYMYALVQEQTAYGMNYQLAVVDLETGNLKLITEYGLMSESGRPVVPCTLAVSTDGRIYTVGAEGMLYTYNPESGMLKEVGMTGYPSGEQIQCMAYDHNADALYWAMVTESFAGIAYVDTETGKAMPVGAIDGGMQMSSLFIVPEERPEGPGEIAVESVTMLEDVVALMEGSEKCVPVEVLPFNATDRKVTWTVADKSVAEINEGMITGKSAGTTAVTGTLTSAGQTFEVSFEIKVIKSAGEMHGYIMADFAMGFGGFWAAFSDTDLSTGEGIISDDSYQLTAGDYYDGKVYGYAIDMNSDTGAFEYVVLDGETLELEKKIPGDYPDFRDMAFDYSTGCMFGVAGLRSVFQGTSLYSVDITTGKCYEIGNTYTKMVYPSWDGSGDIVELIDVTLWGLACTTDGEMYGVDDTGAFYSVDKYTGELTKLFESNQPTNGYSSMACDHNTGNIYWEQAYRDMLSGTSSAYLYLVDPEEKSILEIGQVGMGGCAVTGMHVVPKNEISVGAPDPEHQKMLLNANSKMMKEGNSFELTAALAPISVKDTNLVYSYTSSDENVAVADSNGVITAVGAGKAVITVSCGEVRGECQINVVGADKKLHIVNKGGWETSPLLEPNTILDSVSFQNQFSAATATYHSDGYFYAIGEDGYLWKYTEDLGFVEKIGEKPVAEQFSDYGDFMIGAGQDPRVIDIVSESIAGTQEDKVYVLGFGVIQSMVGYAIGVYNIYELDLETGAAAMVGGLPFDIGNPSAMTFISEDELVVYDYGVQRMFKTKLNCTMNDSAEEILWTGNIVIPEGPMGMVYSQELNMVFMATADNMINGGRIALYTLDPVSGKLEKVSNASYNPGMVDLVIVEGTEPAKGES